MSEIAPPSRGIPPPSPTPPPQASVPAPPPELRALAIGAKLEALVLAVRSDGAVQVRTDLATFDIRPEALPALKPGALVQVLLAAKAPQLRLALLAVDGRPLASGAAGAAPPTVPQAAAGGDAAAGPAAAAHGRAIPAEPVNLTVGSQLTATLLRPATGASSAPGASPPTPAVGGRAAAAGARPDTAPGTTTPVPGTATPSAAGAAAAKAAATSAPRTGTPPVPGTGSPAASPPAPIPAAAGSTLAVRLVAVVPPPPGQTAPAGPPAGPPVVPQPGTPLQGVVVAHPTQQTGGHATVVETRAGTFALPTTQALPPGTQVTLEPLGSLTTPTATAAAHPSAHLSDPALLFGREWPALEESAATLAELSPGAQQAVLQMLARPDTQLGANVLFFLAALRGGDIRSWLGDGPMRVLERLRPELAGRLGEEFSRLARLADEPGSNDWRVAAVPFADGEDVHRIRFLTRQPPQEEDEGDGDHGTRFLVDVELTRLGRLQLDGLVAKDGKRVDLLVRSNQPLPGRMRDDIRVIFQEAAALTGLQGGVGFQAQPAGFVDVAAAVPAASGSTGIEV